VTCRPVRVLALAGTLVSLAGCYVEPEPAYGYTTLTSAPAPVDAYSYPYVYYEGRPTYWVQGRWYYTTPGAGWQYYRVPPPALERQRPYIQQAPPAYRQTPYSTPYTTPPPAMRAAPRPARPVR